MKTTAFFITDIHQEDNFTFRVTWSDGVVHSYRLSELQKKCPCAGCQEGPETQAGKGDVKAARIMSVGRYAIRVEFTSGCSNGIYSYDLLRSLINSPKEPGKRA